MSWEKNFVFFIGVFVLIGFVSASVFDVDFVDPTPGDGAIVGGDSVLINVSILEDLLGEVSFDWDGKENIIYDDSLVLMYNFNKVVALGENETFVRDLSNYGNDGLCADAQCPSFDVNGKFGGAFHYNRLEADNFFVGADDLSSNFPGKVSSPVSAFAWINVDEFTSGIDSSVLVKGNSIFYLFVDGDTQTVSSSFSGVRVDSSSTLSVGEWAYVGIVYDGANMQLYVNGFSDGASAPLAAFPTNVGRFFVGTRSDFSTDKSFDGLIDEVRVWNKALSENEILQNYYGYLNKYDVGKWSLLVEQFGEDGGPLEEADFDYQAFVTRLGDGDEQTEERSVTVCRSDDCFEDLTEIPFVSCTGEGELFLYSGENPFQPIQTEFVVNRDQVLVLARGNFLDSLEVGVDNMSVDVEIVFDTLTPFPVTVLSFNTTPGATVMINGVANGGLNARAIQGYLAQDKSNPVYDPSTLQVIFDDEIANDMFLNSGVYSFGFFDKYTINLPGNSLDNRLLEVLVEDSLGNDVFSQSYTQPAPVGTQGAVVGEFNILSGEDGVYTLSVDTQDSVYWFLAQCEQACEDEDGDGVCDPDDFCKDSKTGEPVDEVGCDIFQFCRTLSCGVNCFEGDWRGNEPDVRFPQDCKVVVPLNNGFEQQPICVPTEFGTLCAN